MIPKIIHYCWFGNKDIPSESLILIETWKKFLPDHQLMLWNEKNSPLDHPYLKRAYELRNWANLSNFMRLYALKNYGGWYFDTDIEILQKPDLSTFKESCFFGIESDWWENEIIVNNAVIAANKNHFFIEKCLKVLENQFDGSEKANLSSPILTTSLLKEYGFQGKCGVFSDIRVFPKNIFYPSSYFDVDHKSKISKESLTIHYYESDWLNLDRMNSKEIKDLYKNMIYYKKNFSRIRLGKISLKEWLSVSLRFLKIK